MSRRSGAVRLYALLLRLYPREFRRLYEPEMLDAFGALHGDTARAAGVRGLAVLWSQTVWDTIRSALRERWNRRGYRVGRRSSLRFPRAGIGAWLSDLKADLSYVARALARSPGYALTIVVTLGLGIGANSAIFSVFNSVLVRPLPFGEGGDVVHLHHNIADGIHEETMPFSVHDIEDYRSRSRTLTDVSEYHQMHFVLTGHGEPDLARVGVVSHNFFDLLEIRPLVGREFVMAEDRRGADPVLVLGHEYWQSKFAGDPAVVGRSVVMNGRGHEIVGVLPPFPQFPEQNDVYMPVSVCPTRSSEAFIANRRAAMMDVYGRLAPDVTLEEARRDLRGIADDLEREYPDVYRPEVGYEADTELVRDELVERARSPLFLLVSVAGFILVIACANAANLALARANRRARELTVRTALGAGRGRLARLLLTESMVLALGGGILGLVLAFAGHDLLVAYAARFTNRAAEITIDLPVLGFTLFAALLTGVVFGVVPALASGPGRSSAGDANSTSSRRSRRVQRGLVVVQVAVAFAILGGATMMLRSLWALYQVDPGIETEGIVSVMARAEDPAYDEPGAIDAFVEEVRVRLEDVSEVVAVARIQEAVLGGDYGHRYTLDDGSGDAVPLIGDIRRVGPNYPDVVGAHLVAGRYPRLDDEMNGSAVLVNESLARQLFGSPSAALGRTIRGCSETPCDRTATVVGVLADVRQHGVDTDPPLEVVVVTDEWGFGGQRLLVRTTDVDEVLPLIPQVVHSVESDAAIAELVPLDQVVRASLEPRRLTSFLLLLFASLAVGLAVAGIFAVLSLSASARSREMGVRKALGARSGEVRAMLVREGLDLVALGLALGLGLALVLVRSFQGLLWGVEGWTPMALVGAGLMFLLVSLVACDVPARRAAASDVMEALNEA